MNLKRATFRLSRCVLTYLWVFAWPDRYSQTYCIWKRYNHFVSLVEEAKRYVLVWYECFTRPSLSYSPVITLSWPDFYHALACL